MSRPIVCNIRGYYPPKYGTQLWASSFGSVSITSASSTPVMGLGSCVDDLGKFCIQRNTNLSSEDMKFSLKRVREDFDQTLTSETPSKTVKRRLVKKHLDFGSDDEKNLFKAIRNKPWLMYHFESSSEEESDHEKMNPAMKSSSLPVGVVRGCNSCEGCQKVLARWRPEAGCKPGLEDAPVFFPLEEEFQDTVKYIASIAAEAEPYGICRIVPPHSWRPPCPLKDSEKRKTAKFPTRVQRLDKLQVRETKVKKEQRKRRRGRPPRNQGDACSDSSDEEGKFGFEPGPLFTLETFENYAKQFKDEYFGLKDEPFSDSSKEEPSVECIEGEYWRIVEHATEQLEVLYGADIETGKFGSGFPKANSGMSPSLYETSGWNLNNIARLGGSILSFEEEEISGVLVPWLYVGMCLSSFCWHVEDHHFYSLNYMHFGSPKVWYGVPGNAAQKLEDAMKKHLPALFEEQPDLLHKLVTQLSPSVLKAEGVPVYRAVQKPGEFVVTFPRAYHAGFNCGFNCAEAVNVAPIDWLPAGQNAVELYSQQKRKSTVSHDKLLLGTVNKYLSVLSHQLSRLPADASSIAWQELFAQHNVLSMVFKERVDLERSRRCKIEGLVHTLRMDKNFDVTDAKECSVCHYDLHLSAIGCECAQDRYTCLEHVCELCGCDKSKKHALYRYELSELDAIMAALQGHHDSMSGVEKLLELLTGSEISKVECDEIIKQEGSIIEQSGSSSSGAGSTSALFGHNNTFPDDSGACLQTTKACAPTESIWNGGFKAMSAFLLKDFENYELLLAGSKNPELPVLGSQARSSELLNPAEPVSCNSRQLNNHPLPCETGPGEKNNSIQSNGHPLPCETGPGERKESVEVIVLSDDEDCPGSNSVPTPLSTVNAPHAISNGSNSGNIHFFPTAATSSQCLSNFAHAINTSHAMAKKRDITEELNSSKELPPIFHKPITQAAWNVLNSQSIQPLVTTFEDNRLQASTLQQTGPVSFSPSFYTSFKECAKETVSTKDWLRLGSLQTTSVDQKGHDLSVMGPPLNPSINEGKFLGGHIDSVRGSLHNCLPLHQRQEVRVDLLSTGRLVLGMSWCNKNAIFPAGFRSRVLFTSFLDPCKMCFYISEVLDYGRGEPLFKVTMEDHPNEVFVHGSIDKCWQMVQERVNIVIQLHRSFGKVGLPPLRSPDDIRGLELFGFTSPHIIKAVELLDWRHQCLEYWTGRMSAIGLLQTQFQPQFGSVIGSENVVANQQSQTLLERAAPFGFNTMPMHNLWQ
ncbi:hypothetical protein GOP47_0030054 [Adiantum capillus-veneris]|nr:hypothetical protein GOP47_0030054 [Adiantum capillus-veneris]